MVVPEMMRFGAPAYLIILVILLGFHSDLPQQVDLQFVELFAGTCSISLGLMANGLRGSSHDIEMSRYMDLSSTAGFLYLGNRPPFSKRIPKKSSLNPVLDFQWFVIYPSLDTSSTNKELISYIVLLKPVNACQRGWRWMKCGVCNVVGYYGWDCVAILSPKCRLVKQKTWLGAKNCWEFRYVHTRRTCYSKRLVYHLISSVSLMELQSASKLNMVLRSSTSLCPWLFFLYIRYR